MSLIEAAERTSVLSEQEALAAPAPEDVIVVEGLRKRYGASEAVSGLDLRGPV